MTAFVDEDFRRVSRWAELVRASKDDRFLLAELDPAADFAGYARAGAVAWVGRRRPGRPHWLTAVGDPSAAADLVTDVVRARRDRTGQLPASLTVPRGAMPLLPDDIRPASGEDWDWFWTDGEPPVVRAEGRVEQLDAEPEELVAFLALASPRHSLVPGSDSAREWWGIRGGDGILLATASWTTHGPGVPHLASIATLPHARGRGYGAAVTAVLTRRLLRNFGWVTLGMYADNDVARRMYLRLGYRNEHRFTSGRRASATPSGASGAHYTED